MKSNYNIYDDHIKNVKEHNYTTESYNLYRLELSLYLFRHSTIKNKIIDIVRNTQNNYTNNEKKIKLRNILFKILNKKLSDEYKIINDDNDIKYKEQFIHITNKIPNLENYTINNMRDNCDINKNKDKCNNSFHCKWENNNCKLQLLENLSIDFVNKVIEEMIYDNIHFKEIIQENNYYVSDIVDYTQYTNRSNQKIIKTSNFNITKLMSELFGKNKIPMIGKRQFTKLKNNIIDESYPELIELGNQYIQEIISNKDSVIRAYVNSYYWINNPLYDVKSRNLGYINDFQTTTTALLKAHIIDYIQNILESEKKKSNISENIIKYITKIFKNNDNIFESALNKFRKTLYNTDGKIELFILSHLIELPILIYDNYSNVKYIFFKGELDVTEATIKKYTSSNNLNNTIYLKFDYDNSLLIPKKIYSIYYI